MQEAVPIVGAREDYDALLDLVGNRRLVLLGEATHGTHDFYRERARITMRLIDEKGFNAVAVEADWPDAYRVNRYVMGESSRRRCTSALSDFQRFPAWMWRNRDVCGFVGWLRARNDSCSDRRSKARFYGLDLYSLRASMEAVITYLDVVDAEAADAARARYSCFDHVGDVGARYGRAIALDLKLPCEDEVSLSSPTSSGEAAGSWPPTAALRRTSSSMPSRTRCSSATRSGTTGRCTARRVVVEPPGPPHGRGPPGAGQPPRPPARSIADRRVGAQLPRR